MGLTRSQVRAIPLLLEGLYMDWEPARADHSIDRVIASITLTRPIDPNTFDELIVAGRKAAAEHHLTNRLELQDPIELPAAPAGGIIIGPLGNLTAPRRVLFNRPEAGSNIPVEEVAIGVQQFVFGTTRYQRWAQFNELITSVMAALESVYPVTQNAKFARLEYVDRFRSVTGGADHFEVLSQDSGFLTKAVRGKEHALHVHCGWFDFESPTIRKLTNVNIDVNDVTIPPPPDPRRTITVLSIGQFEALQGLLDNPLNRLSTLHNYLKETFRTIITPEAAARVGLNN
jgi:uncharacterized protein (TIGR04255 family)